MYPLYPQSFCAWPMIVLYLLRAVLFRLLSGLRYVCVASVWKMRDNKKIGGIVVLQNSGLDISLRIWAHWLCRNAYWLQYTSTWLPYNFNVEEVFGVQWRSSFSASHLRTEGKSIRDCTTLALSACVFGTQLLPTIQMWGLLWLSM